jgi:hypothetical protein
MFFLIRYQVYEKLFNNTFSSVVDLIIIQYFQTHIFQEFMHGIIDRVINTDQQISRPFNLF